MIRLSLAAMASALVLAACATQTAPVEGPTAPVVVPSQYELGMNTAEELRDAGNVPTAIQRLMQLAGDTEITPNQKANVLYELGVLSMSPTGYDVPGAVGYFDEVIATYPGTEWARRAEAKLPEARAQLAALNSVLDSPNSTNTERFYALMNLGRHLDAIDLMTQYTIEPDNDVKLAMYQIGYLCDESGLTGQSYTVTDRDGTTRRLRFCDFGK
ncbi:MAG: tetratricopeptide repeat protein [Hyphomonas sp.]